MLSAAPDTPGGMDPPQDGQPGKDLSPTRPPGYGCFIAFLVLCAIILVFVLIDAFRPNLPPTIAARPTGTLAASTPLPGEAAFNDFIRETQDLPANTPTTDPRVRRAGVKYFKRIGVLPADYRDPTATAQRAAPPPPAPPPAQVSLPAPAPFPPLGLRLVGIVEGESRLAVMRDYDRHYSLREGDPITNGWVISRILPGKVVIRHPESGAATTIALGELNYSIPSITDSGIADVPVRSYVRKDGTFVRSHYRTRPRR